MVSFPVVCFAVSTTFVEGLSFLTLWFTRESAAQCEAVVQSYAEGRPMPGAPSEKTRGLYYRTVL